MKQLYLDIMEKSFHAYDRKRICDYITEVQKNGLSEHGFARLAADLAILNAFGRCTDYHDVMLEMMDLCCRQMPHRKAANEFSVREIVCAINLLDQKKIVDSGRIQGWIADLSRFEAQTDYNVVTRPFESKGNWAAFGAVSELVRSKMCGVDSSSFIDNQVSSLLGDFDENGMYRDPHEPMVYDCVTRVLVDYLLFAGYNGKYRDILAENVEKASYYAVRLPSVSGELPFGGRSNQFLHNQMWLAADMEFLAAYYASKGDRDKAGQFKATARKATENLTRWLEEPSLRSIKNRYPVESMIGCEEYGYFNKYMITLASIAFVAYQFSDDTIVPTKAPCEADTYVCRTSEAFHKVVLNGFGYSMELDTNADFHYDACGLGKLQKNGYPDTLCLSVPFPPKNAFYQTEKDNERAMSLCIWHDIEGKIVYGSEIPLTLVEKTIEPNAIKAVFSQQLDGCEVNTVYSLSPTGAELCTDDNANGFAVPVFEFDGESYTDIRENAGEISVCYRGYTCRFIFDGTLDKSYERYYNRNGRYRVYKISSKKLHIMFEKKEEVQ